MMNISDLLDVADTYKAATGILSDTTVSFRVFGDSKKLAALRAGKADITVGRFHAALRWFADNWPEEASFPATLADLRHAAQLTQRGAVS